MTSQIQTSERIDNAAHWVQTEAPDAFNTLLLDWLTTTTQFL